MAGDPGPSVTAGEPEGEEGAAGAAVEVEVEVLGFDNTSAGFDELDRLVGVARTTLLGEGLTGGRLDLVAVDVEEMADLNATHMGHEGPTDVLSFPLDVVDQGHAGIEPASDGEDPPVHLGDVIICPHVASVQAPQHCGTDEAELSLLVIHGVLHVLGHDHDDPEEAAVMQARERHYLAAFGHPHPGPQVASC